MNMGYIRHCQGSNSGPVPPQVGADTTRPQWRPTSFDCSWSPVAVRLIKNYGSKQDPSRTQQNSWESPAEWWSVWPHWHSGSILWWPQGSNFDTSSWHRHNYYRKPTTEENKHHRRASFHALLSLYYICRVRHSDSVTKPDYYYYYYYYYYTPATHSSSQVKIPRSAKYKKIVDPVIQRNEYFAHSENLLLAMITDHRPHIWELGLRRLIKARATNLSRQVQRFKVPAKPNFDSVEYFDMIDRALCPISEPLVTKVMTDAELSGEFRGRIGPCPRVPKKNFEIEKNWKTWFAPF